MRLRNAARATLASLLWVSLASAETANVNAAGKAAVPAASVGTSATVAATPAAAGATAATPAAAGASAATTQSGTAPAASPAPAPASSAAPAPAATTTMDGSTYAVRLRDLESRVDDLKEQIRRSHTRLSLLSDTILSGGVGGARAEIRFKNEMSSAFQLTHALFVLDGAVQYNKSDDTGALASQPEIPIFSGAIPPGDHTLQVLVQLRGHGYGVFSYLRGYKFEVKSSHSFTVTEGKSIQLDAVAWEKGGVTTPLEQRPAVRYVEKLKTGLSGDALPSAPTSEPTSSVSGSLSVGAGSK